MVILAAVMCLDIQNVKLKRVSVVWLLLSVFAINPRWLHKYTTNLFHNVLFYFQTFAQERD